MLRKLLCLGIIGFFALVTLYSPGRAGDKQAPTAQLDKAAPDFTLVDTDGNEHSLSDYEGKFVVLEWTNMDCPFVKKHYNSGNMQELQKQYTAEGVVWLRICSSGEGREGYYEGDAIDQRVKKDKAMQTAYLLDTDGAVGRSYGAKTTPHMFVIDTEGTLIYAGGIDDKPSTNTADIESANNYVAGCLDAAMSGEAYDTKSTNPYGCSVKYAKK